MEAEFSGAATTPSGGYRKRKAQADLRRPQRSSSSSSSSNESSAAASSVYKARTTDFRVLAEAFPSLRPLYLPFTLFEIGELGFGGGWGSTTMLTHSLVLCRVVHRHPRPKRVHQQVRISKH
jgi:hypothetical protein